MKILRIISVILCLSLFACAAYSAYVVYEARGHAEKVLLPDLAAGRWRTPGKEPRPILVRDADLSPEKRRVLLLVQDPGFMEHGGVDLSTPGAGLTTITQSIVKKLFFQEFKAGPAKLRQTLIACFVVDPMVSKSDQITLFLNTIYLGKVQGTSVTGFAEGAQAYYGKPFAELDDDEFIGLVAPVVAPSTFHMIDHPEWHAQRVERIKKLAAGEYLPKGLMDQFYGPLSEEILQAGIPPSSYRAGYFEKP